MRGRACTRRAGTKWKTRHAGCRTGTAGPKTERPAHTAREPDQTDFIRPKDGWLISFVNLPRTTFALRNLSR